MNIRITMQQPVRQDLRERTFAFACSIVNYCAVLAERRGVGSHIGYQLLKSGTSVGANLEEAKGAYSDREFVVKNCIALKEARETLYWLRLASSCQLSPPEIVQPLLKEAGELVAILTVTVKTARSRLKRRPGPNG